MSSVFSFLADQCIAVLLENTNQIFVGGGLKLHLKSARIGRKRGQRRMSLEFVRNSIQSPS